MAGREFKSISEGFRWYTVANGNRTMFCKLNDDNLKLALAGLPFEVWHMCMPTEKGIAPFCVNTKTLEPWVIGSFQFIGEIHSDVAKELEAAFEEMTRSIQIATSMPKIKPPGKIELVN